MTHLLRPDKPADRLATYCGRPFDPLSTVLVESKAECVNCLRGYRRRIQAELDGECSLSRVRVLARRLRNVEQRLSKRKVKR